MSIFGKIKSHKIFWGVVIALLFIVVLDLTARWYEMYQDQKKVENLAKSLEEMDRLVLEARAADKIGGKTPQETLDLFINAVEKGDYELASKYFVLEEKENTKKELLILDEKNKTEWYLAILKNAKSDGEIKDGSFRMRSKLENPPDYLINFSQYPSGNWKIEKI
ncbi:MAG: hypothetical protein PHC85_00295 [Candidatus Pacebacteria bacterium]|nr:hypothetical protein [Candidatus Paceibacterota bacterium]